MINKISGRHFYQKFAYLLIGRYICREMSTRDEIVTISDTLIREKGYNAFSYTDISKALSIRNASIHYYFPTKTDLAIAVIDRQITKLAEMVREAADKDPVEQLKAYLSIYSHTNEEGSVCIVGSLASDLYSIDERISNHLKMLVDNILVWVTGILENGRSRGVFHFDGIPRTKALLVITNMLASLQLVRLTDNEKDFETIKETVLKEITI